MASPLACGLVKHMLETKSMDAMIWELRKSYKKRAAALLDGLVVNCPSIRIANEVEGGYFVWCELPEQIDDPKAFAAVCVEHYDLNFLPGNACFHHNCGAENGRMIRLCFAMYQAADLWEATRRLRSAMEHFCQRTESD